MKKMFLAACAAGLLLTGCTLVTSTETERAFNSMKIGEGNATPQSHASVQMDGLYFLGSMPIVSGGMENGKCVWFRDSVSADTAMRVLTFYLRGKGGNRILYLHSEYHSTALWYTLFLFSYRELTISGSAI